MHIHFLTKVYGQSRGDRHSHMGPHMFAHIYEIGVEQL